MFLLDRLLHHNRPITTAEMTRLCGTAKTPEDLNPVCPACCKAKHGHGPHLQTSRLCPTHEATEWRKLAKAQSSRLAAFRHSLEIAVARNDDLEMQIVELQNRIAELETEVHGMAGVAMAALKVRA